MSLPPTFFPRPLGSTGLEVSALGYGTVKFGRREGVKYPEPFNIPGDRMALRLLADARDAGINLLDTAPAYGTSEERLGDILKGWRDVWHIVTKAGETFENGKSTFDFTPESITSSVERSLQRLQTDRVECVLLHSDGRDIDAIDEGALDALIACKFAGKTRAVGVSTKTPEGSHYAMERGADVLMVELNEHENSQVEVIKEAHSKGVGVLIKKALASGHAAKSKDPSSSVRRAFSHVFGSPGVTSVVMGTINRDHLASNIASASEILSKQ